MLVYSENRQQNKILYCCILYIVRLSTIRRCKEEERCTNLWFCIISWSYVYWRRILCTWVIVRLAYYCIESFFSGVLTQYLTHKNIWPIFQTSIDQSRYNKHIGWFKRKIKWFLTVLAIDILDTEAYEQSSN